MPRLDPAAIMAAAIHQHVEDMFADMPFKLRYKHIAKAEDCHWVTVYRRCKSDPPKLPQPCRDEKGDPWWAREPYKADFLERMLSEQARA